MSPLPTNPKFHFSHPNHPLVLHSDDREYTCGGCKTSGSDNRFRCHVCNFDLHTYCADCPEKLPPSIHHHHLTLLIRKPKHARTNELFCDVCQEHIDALFYRCDLCPDFNIHPVCTQLPKHFRHVAPDPNHTLALQKPPFGNCALCQTDCSSRWVYGCDICQLYFHLDCVLEPYVSPLVRSESTSRGIPPLSAPGGGYPWSTVGSWGGQFFHPHPYPYQYPDPYGNYGGCGYATPYSVPDHQFVQQNFGFVHHEPSGGGNEAAPSSTGKKFTKSMFWLVGRLTVGVLTTSLIGFPITF